MAALLPSARINTVTYSDEERGLRACVEALPDFRAMLSAHVAAVVDDFMAAWSPRQYLEHNRAQWAALHGQLSTLSGGANARMP